MTLAIATHDEAGHEYLLRQEADGMLSRTDHPINALLWSDRLDVLRWLDSLPEPTRSGLVNRKAWLVRVEIPF